MSDIALFPSIVMNSSDYDELFGKLIKWMTETIADLKSTGKTIVSSPYSITSYTFLKDEIRREGFKGSAMILYQWPV